MTTTKQKLDAFLFRKLVNFLYPKYIRPRYGYSTYYRILKKYAFYQKILKINNSVKWPVDKTSVVVCPENITKGYMCDPGDNIGNYIQASNGIVFGNNVELGPGVKIISSNHNFEDFSKIIKSKPIVIGDNVWIGANSVVLPGIKIGNNVIVGAGSVVVKDLPSNSVAVGNPCKVISEKKEHVKTSDIEFNQKVK
ncbi:DapH/DapD/GlmU-related protein [Wenyingzhuangia sp.]|uniref:DapH/DapD/GlmU-related protein n=1 Tax=Wenyingzhuangia sp. TaxID=1964193 RepID=UPI00321B03F8